MPKNVSLYQFEQRHKVNRGTVSKRAQSMEYKTKYGLTWTAYLAMCTAFGVTPWDENGNPPPEQPKSDGSGQDAAIAPKVEVPAGFFVGGEMAPYQGVQTDLPATFDPAAMAAKFDGAQANVVDVKGLFSLADRMIDLAEAAVIQKVAAQDEQLASDIYGLNQLRDRVQEGKLSLAVRGLESRILAREQERITGQAQQVFSDLVEMGQPPGGSSSSS